MFVVLINGEDRSYHTQQIDAEVQKARFEAAGHSNVVIVEKATFSPPAE